jgi:hypothetical protein
MPNLGGAIRFAAPTWSEVIDAVEFWLEPKEKSSPENEPDAPDTANSVQHAAIQNGKENKQ